LFQRSDSFPQVIDSFAQAVSSRNASSGRTVLASGSKQKSWQYCDQALEQGIIRNRRQHIKPEQTEINNSAFLGLKMAS
jgi:hypothetical protein